MLNKNQFDGLTKADVNLGNVVFASEAEKNNFKAKLDLSEGGTAPTVYLTMPALYADQANQVLHGNYRVDDASAHPDVNAGRAWFDYKGTTAGDHTDYILKSEEESLNLDAQLTAIENRLTALEAKQEFTLAEKNKLVGLIPPGVVPVSTSRLIAASDNGKKLFITTAVTLTWPSPGLGASFECNAVTSEAGTLTMADQAATPGNDLDAPDGKILQPRNMAHLFVRPDNGKLTLNGTWTE